MVVTNRYITPCRRWRASSYDIKRERGVKRDYNEATFCIHELLLKMVIFSLLIFKNVLSIFGAQRSLWWRFYTAPLKDQLSVTQCGQLCNIIFLVFLLKKSWNSSSYCFSSLLIPQVNFFLGGRKVGFSTFMYFGY